MNHFAKLLALTLAASGMLTSKSLALITIETVAVGNAGNAADPRTGLGTVDYDYRIGTYEVTLTQYASFLNAVGATDTYGLYHPRMGTDLRSAGIAQSGVSGSYTYSVIGSGNRPVTYVSWYDALRFANWLGNGQPTGAQAAGTTESGAYDLSGGTPLGLLTRNSSVIRETFVIPTVNEWYKAAYYQPVGQGGDGDDYWLYPTRSNSQPNSRNGSSSDPNSANYYYDDGVANGFNGGYAVNNSTAVPSGNALTDVGAFSLADSFYGTFDQGGNVWEWNEAVYPGARNGPVMGIGGGGWGGEVASNYPESLTSMTATYTLEPFLTSHLGFRVAIAPVFPVPEPGTMSLVGLGTFALLFRRKVSILR